MKSFNIRELKYTDTEALLAFENENRAWFESHIDPRPPAFYSLQGVGDHIADCLSACAQGTWHPFVVEDSAGNIVGRANLKDIHSPENHAQVGYRIAAHACGLGLATQALQHLIHQAQHRWSLTQLVAYAYLENIGSRKVLERCGFEREQPVGHDETANGRRYVLSIQ